ncbi:MAG: NmrA/HSCARG family protein [Acidobacteria bacterium]|nr:MAG: NmrA/HSCARG family protein [Acidobacteriota bacterium]
MASERTVLITGATGKQGGATARALKDKGFRLRAMTRKPESEAAKAVAAETGAELVPGDLNDAASLKDALNGAWGVFSVQNTWEAGVQLEEEQGKRIATLAKEAGVQHFVYTSVGSAHRKTGIPHFENKSRIEDTIRGLGFPSHVIVRPVFFMENLTSPWFLNGDNLYAAMPPGLKLQMIAVEDIGKYAARAFTDADRLNRREIDLAGDEATMPEVATALSRGLRRNISFVQIPIAEVRKNSEDFAMMLEWFERVGYDADIAALDREFGIQPTTLTEWAGKQR